MYFFHREDIRRALFVHRGCGVAEKKMFLVLPLSRCFGWQDWKRERGKGPGHKGTSLKRGAASRNTNFRPPRVDRALRKKMFVSALRLKFFKYLFRCEEKRFYFRIGKVESKLPWESELSCFKVKKNFELEKQNCWQKCL